MGIACLWSDAEIRGPTSEIDSALPVTQPVCEIKGAKSLAQGLTSLAGSIA
jgi:hypothetical protein